jgi:tRNA A-37 threonylcarbamoyl transferase component Bud32/tetratricopeptide (TPR) repeat protein
VLPTPTSFRPESLVGTTLDGRYRLAAHLASGGMGAIYRAEHVYMRKEVAVKVLRPELSGLSDIAERFRRESEIAASLEHDNIVRVTDFGRSPDGWLFLVMELLEGESLFERLRRSGPMMQEEAVQILVQICSGLEVAHARGVVHRDLKPENVFLTARPAGGVKILDFGIAKLTDPQIASDTQVGVVVGTPEYLSPEQALGGAIDSRADLYAVGLIAWRMLAGHHPFKAEDGRALLMMQATRPVPPLSEARPDLVAWPALLSAIARACAKEVAERHPSAAELRADLEACLGSLYLPPPPATTSAARARATPRQAVATPFAMTHPSWPLEATVTLDASALALPAAPPGPPPRRGAGFLRAHRVALGIAAAAALLVPTGLAAARWLEQRPLARAEELLASNRPEAARDVLAHAVERRPDDARLRALHGRALHRIRGGAPAALDAYARALDRDPNALDAAALADLASDLSDRRLADHAARLLARVGPPAVPAVLGATKSGPGSARLRALELARDLGAEERVDRVAAYVALLGDEACEVRRAAARRLGDIGTAAAVPKLSELAKATRPIRGLFGVTQRVPQCSATDAEAALRRIAKARRDAGERPVALPGRTR